MAGAEVVTVVATLVICLIQEMNGVFGCVVVVGFGIGQRLFVVRSRTRPKRGFVTTSLTKPPISELLLETVGKAQYFELSSPYDSVAKDVITWKERRCGRRAFAEVLVENKEVAWISLPSIGLDEFTCDSTSGDVQVLQGPLGEEKTRFNPTLAPTDHSPAAAVLGDGSKDFRTIQSAPRPSLDAACGQRAQ